MECYHPFISGLGLVPVLIYVLVYNGNGHSTSFFKILIVGTLHLLLLKWIIVIGVMSNSNLTRKISFFFSEVVAVCGVPLKRKKYLN